MSKGRSKKVRSVPMLRLNSVMTTELLGDLRLYDRIPAFVPLRDRVIRLRDQIEDRMHDGIRDVASIFRQRTDELSELFEQVLYEQLMSGNIAVFEALKVLLRERHNVDATKLLFCYGEPVERFIV